MARKTSLDRFEVRLFADTLRETGLERARAFRLPDIAGVKKPWAALLLATEPVWRIPLPGFNPTLDEWLRIRCLVHE